MDHDMRAFAIEQRLPPEPFQQLVSIIGGEDILDGVFGPQGGEAFCRGEQEQVVIAQDDLRGGPKLFEIAKDAKRGWAAIDQIANAPEAVYRGIEPDQFEQPL